MKSRQPIAPPPYRTDPAALEHEVDVETYRARGPGGQHRNVTDSAVRLLHRPSGVRVSASESRSQHRNRERAFARLVERLEALNRVPRRRVPTKVSKRAAERRLVSKQRRQIVKQLRTSVRQQEE
jgi:protein subunit release factor A